MKRILIAFVLLSVVFACNDDDEKELPDYTPKADAPFEHPIIDWTVDSSTIVMSLPFDWTVKAAGPATATPGVDIRYPVRSYLYLYKTGTDSTFLRYFFDEDGKVCVSTYVDRLNESTYNSWINYFSTNLGEYWINPKNQNIMIWNAKQVDIGILKVEDSERMLIRFCNPARAVYPD